MSKIKRMQPSTKENPAKKRWSRKKKILVSIAVVIGLLLLSESFSLLHTVIGTTPFTNVGKASFDQAMPIPALADSTIQNGVRTFNLNLQTGTRQFLPGQATSTWGVNGDYLGPTLRATRGEKVQINVTNNLPEDTSIHWHGMHLPAVMDGGPHQPIAKGATWSPTWTINQPAATLWYHPHPHGSTEPHTYRGIAGMFIIDDQNTPAGLPHTYGVDDLPVIVQDKQFDSNNQFQGGNQSDDTPIGTLGNVILVNGAVTPHVDVKAQRVRLRLLNGSTARIYNFSLSNGGAMQMVASDGGLSEHPTSLQHIRLSPGERAEVVVDIKPNERIALQSLPESLGTQFINDSLVGAQDSFDILQLRGADALADSPAVPINLTTISSMANDKVAATRTFTLDSDRAINNKHMDLSRIDFSVQKDTTEIWTIANHDGLPHSFHIHDVQFQILSIDGAAPPPELAGRKDTILLLPEQSFRIGVHFADYSDPNHPYMYHCHLLRHEDAGMMGQFVVVDPGQSPGSIQDMSHMPGM